MDSLPVLWISWSPNRYRSLSTVTFSKEAELCALLSSMTVSEILVLIRNALALYVMVYFSLAEED